MEKKVFYFLIFIIFFNLGCIGNNPKTESNQERMNLENGIIECMDCGKAGWQLMSTNCGEKILDVDSAQKCFKRFNLSYSNHENIQDEIILGNIKLETHGIADPEMEHSIQAYIYRRWAIDEMGMMYLDSELG